MTIDKTIETARFVATEKKEKAEIFIKDTMPHRTYINCAEQYEQIADWLEELKAYKEADEQGLLLRLPCKLGTPVYNTTWWDTVEEKVKIKGKTYYRTTNKHKVSKAVFTVFDIDDFGKTVFLTKKEAKQALAEQLKAEVDEQ